MRLLVIEKDSVALDRVAKQVAEICKSVSFGVTVAAALLDEMGAQLAGQDLLLLGVGLNPAEKAAAVRVSAEFSPLTKILLITPAAFRLAEPAAGSEAGVFALIPEDHLSWGLAGLLQSAFSEGPGAEFQAPQQGLIAGRYKVLRCIGAGSMGMVYVCSHSELREAEVAVKVLFSEVAKSAEARARFRDAVFASYAISSEFVVRTYEYFAQDGVVACTMEYVKGGDLSRLLDAPTCVPIASAVRMLCQLAQGLEAIHAAGIIHRNLKPENILLTPGGDIKICDFDAALSMEAGPHLTSSGAVVGSVDYLSPEYMLDGQVDLRADIYALGNLAYELICGQAPFLGDSVYATMTKRLKSDPAPPSSLRPECPKQLDAIVLKAMARDPEARYQSATQLLAALRAL